MRSFKSLVVSAVFAVAFACGGDSTPQNNNPPPSTPKITIQGSAFSPAALTVNAGDSIEVTNLDTKPHTATSETNPGDFTAGAVSSISFDTGNLTQNQKATITIPASAPSGTVIPYFCVVHGQMMGEGTITVR